jgi:hypothetical protein
MASLNEGTVQKMMNEDNWLRSPNGILTMMFASSTGDFQDGCLETKIHMAEVDSMVFNDSPALHGYLGTLYMGLKDELSPELKRQIEKDKVKQISKEYLFDYYTKTTAERIAALPSKGQDMGENINAAKEILDSCNIAMYVQHTNILRAQTHIEKALTLSKDNPTVFEHLIEPAALLLMVGWIPAAISYNERCDGDIRYEAAAFMRSRFAKSYNEAKQRVSSHQI